MIVFNNFTIPKGLGMDYSVYQDYIQDNTVEEYCFTYVSDDFVDTCIDKVSLVKKKQPGKVKVNTKKKRSKQNEKEEKVGKFNSFYFSNILVQFPIHLDSTKSIGIHVMYRHKKLPNGNQMPDSYIY